VFVSTRNREEGGQESGNKIEAEQKTRIFEFLESLHAIDIKEYPVKDSQGDKMRIIFTIRD
jgi:hypothetical protein